MIPLILALAKDCMAGKIDAQSALSDFPGDWLNISIGGDSHGNQHLRLDTHSDAGPGHIAIRFAGDLVYWGRQLSFGYPLPGAFDPSAGFSWYVIPERADMGYIKSLAEGAMPFSEFHELVNYTALWEMSVPRPHFPKSCLIMLLGPPKPFRSGLPQRPDCYFQLWTQHDGKITVETLPQTSNPFTAAEHARELGFSPTVYRCSSGQFIAFTATPGAAFMP